MIEHVIQLADAYVMHTGLKLSSVSTYATNDGKWLSGLKAGTTGCTVGRAARVTKWFSDNWPVNLAWPRDVPRPSKVKVAA